MIAAFWRRRAEIVPCPGIEVDPIVWQHDARRGEALSLKSSNSPTKSAIGILSRRFPRVRRSLTVLREP